MAVQIEEQFMVIERKRVSEVVMDQIKEMIIGSKLTIGDRLPPERELAKQLGVSRAPVREALFSLANSGLLEIKQGAKGGVFVTEPKLEPYAEFFTLMLRMKKAGVQELTEARLFLEPNIARLATERATPEDLENMERSILAYEKKIELAVDRGIEDMEFHMNVAKASRNIVLTLMIEGLMGLLYKSVKDFDLSNKNMEKSADAHRGILEAIRNRDSESAFNLMSDHVKKMVNFWK